MNEWDEFEFTTRLRPGRELDYERAHASIPIELDSVMRAAGVLEWRIERRDLKLIHSVRASDRAEMARKLDTDPVNLRWQSYISDFLDPEIADEDVDDATGPTVLVWDFSWPARATFEPPDPFQT